jgi:hypothetical protein
LLFEAALQISGKEVICDSSKDAGRTRVFLEDAQFDCQVIHLVRDGRAVAYSYKRLAMAGQPSAPPWHNYFSALNSWARINAICQKEFGSLPSTLLVRYEDLVEYPAEMLTRILIWLGLQFEEAQLRFWEQVHHNLCGNRMRMEKVQTIRWDREYLTKLSNWEWNASSAINLESLRQYGYPLSRSAERGSLRCSARQSDHGMYNRD